MAYNDAPCESFCILHEEAFNDLVHELRTPLAVIRGYLELFLTEQMGELSADQRQVMQCMLRNTQRLHMAIEFLLVMQEMYRLYHDLGAIHEGNIPLDGHPGHNGHGGHTPELRQQDGD